MMQFFEVVRDENGNRISKSGDTVEKLTAEIFTTALCDRCTRPHLKPANAPCFRPLD